MKDQSSSDVAGVENPCIAGAEKSGVEQRSDKPLETTIAALVPTLKPAEAREIAERLLHPTGRHPEGGCVCTDESRDPACEFHAASPSEPVEARNAVDEALSDVHNDCVDRPRDVELTLAAEVLRLREESERRNNSANAWNEKACELEREARRLRDQLAIETIPTQLKRNLELTEQLEAARAEVALMGASLKQQDEELAKLKNELEVERMRLTGCGVAALGYFDGCAEEYKSASLSDVLKLRGETETLSAKLARVEAEVAAVRRLRDAASSDRDHTVAAAFETAAMYIDDALRDEPQTEREPKLPYNGY